MIGNDMSEYMEKFSVSDSLAHLRIHVGYDEGGQLTGSVGIHTPSLTRLQHLAAGSGRLTVKVGW